ncbi:helix-turn-helix transcriptional regulator [bacterium]|nr:helix-turn-helix transcriptional regulator [bacterium]MDE6224011.1 helix-turn-helix domain-containing protein [Alphaproteobacteria bacterium]
MEEKLRLIRVELAKTQKEMSTLLGLGTITWQNYERGISKPNLKTLQKLTDLGFNINFLTSDDEPMFLKDKIKQSQDNRVEEASFINLPSSSINKLKIFNMILNEMRLLYENVDLSNKEQNYLENRAFDMTINILNVAQNDTDAIRMIKLLLNQEKGNIQK